MLKSWQHVGIRRYGTFLRQVYDLLDDDGTFVLQVAGLRPAWQYEDLVWCAISITLVDHALSHSQPFRGLFMNKYIFPGADASCSLGWVIKQVCLLTFFPRPVLTVYAGGT